MNANIASRLPKLAELHPERVAVSAPIGGKPNKQGFFEYETLTFKEIEERSNLYANNLLKMGLKKGQRVLLFIRPSLDFSAVTFAVFKAGLIPVFIDPGMGRKNLLKAVTHIQPDGLIAEPEVHFLRLLFRRPFRSIKYFVTTKGLTWSSMQSLKTWKQSQVKTPSPVLEMMAPEDSAAILFTSGGTGIPKGVRYTHKIFNSQVDKLKEMFSLGPDEVDLPGFPLFSLFTITMGMKSAIPAMNPSKPAQCNPAWLVKNIIDHQASFVAGSPAIWKRVATYCLENKITLPSVKYLVMFGAPIPLSLHEDFKKILSRGDTFTPYGATECLPVANISGTEVLKYHSNDMNKGLGTCVGYPAPDTTVKVAPITDAAFTNEEDLTWLETNQLGEICILSDTVTPEYVDMPQKTAEAKIYRKDGKIWHRMGDLGRIDESGKVWFCGRKSHRIEFADQILPSVPQETPFYQLPFIKKCAYVGPVIKGEMTPSLIIEPHKTLNSKEKKKMEFEIVEWAKNNMPQTPLKRVYFHSQFPVDVRHNIKIDRLKLSQMVEQGRIR
jgi:acyl-CoA synthetase (AMP-forming)/AMP-acid ligase II